MISAVLDGRCFVLFKRYVIVIVACRLFEHGGRFRTPGELPKWVFAVYHICRWCNILRQKLHCRSVNMETPSLNTETHENAFEGLTICNETSYGDTPIYLLVAKCSPLCGPMWHNRCYRCTMCSHIYIYRRIQWCHCLEKIEFLMNIIKWTARVRDAHFIRHSIF